MCDPIGDQQPARQIEGGGGAFSVTARPKLKYSGSTDAIILPCCQPLLGEAQLRPSGQSRPSLLGNVQPCESKRVEDHTRDPQESLDQAKDSRHRSTSGNAFTHREVRCNWGHPDRVDLPLTTVGIHEKGIKYSKGRPGPVEA